MNHQEALDTKAVERLVICEMTPRQRAEFIEHLLRCDECSSNLNSALELVSTAKAVLAETSGPKPG